MSVILHRTILPIGYGRLANIFKLDRFVTTIHRLGAMMLPLPGNDQWQPIREKEEQRRNLELRHAGPIRGGHRCRETCYAHCSCSFCPCSALPHLHTTSGLAAGPIRIPPANGAAGPKTAAWYRATPSKQASAVIRCAVRSPTAWL